MKKKILYILLIICLIIFLYSSFNIIIWIINSKDIKNQTNKIINTTPITVITDDSNIKIISQSPDYYNLYKDVEIISVDFDKIKTTNKETIGWIKINNTKINYPIVQTKDNKYYLKHSFDLSKNNGGWIFMDYRNNPNFEDQNTIIYGHGRKDKTMFGTLGNILKNNYFDKEENKYIMTSTPKYNMTWEIFSAYNIPTTSDYLYTNFNTEEEYQIFLQKLKDRNTANINVEISSSNKIITLSTCYNNEIKTVVHGKLIKIQER